MVEQKAAQKTSESVVAEKLAPTTPLGTRFQIWAMVKKQNKQQQEDMSETYQHANKVVAEFGTVGEFWQVYSHFRRPSVLPIGTFVHYVSINGDLSLDLCHPFSFSSSTEFSPFGRTQLAQTVADGSSAPRRR